MNSDKCRDFIAEAGETCRPVTELNNTALFVFMVFGISLAFLAFKMIKEK